jgi:hypothetical protein
LSESYLRIALEHNRISAQFFNVDVVMEQIVDWAGVLVEITITPTSIPDPSGTLNVALKRRSSTLVPSFYDNGRLILAAAYVSLCETWVVAR